MAEIFVGECTSCDTEMSVTIDPNPNDSIPGTCPLCGSMMEFEAEGEGDDE